MLISKSNRSNSFKATFLVNMKINSTFVDFYLCLSYNVERTLGKHR